MGIISLLAFIFVLFIVILILLVPIILLLWGLKVWFIKRKYKREVKNGIQKEEDGRGFGRGRDRGRRDTSSRYVEDRGREQDFERRDNNDKDKREIGRRNNVQILSSKQPGRDKRNSEEDWADFS